MARLGTNRIQTRPANLSLTYHGELKFGGAVSPYRLVKVASDGDIEAAGYNEAIVLGVYTGSTAAASGDKLQTDKELGYLGVFPVVADAVITLPARLKSATGGKVIQLIDASLAGGTIDDDATAGNFGNQPANDGVELISDSASDVQSATVYYTRNALGDTVFSQTVTMDGTTQVVLTHTDVQLVLGVELSSAAVGTITVREASGNLAITTISAAGTASGVEAVDAANQNAYNQEPTAVADGASTKQVGLIGTDETGAALMDSQALNGTTAVTMNQEFKTVTKVLVGDVATGTAVTFNVGAEDDEHLAIGQALEAASAADDIIDAIINPR